MRTDGLKVIITGGGSGIGLAVAKRLAATNDVVICGRDQARLDAACEHVPGLRAQRLDVTDPTLDREFEEIVAGLGGLNLLVNAAGVIKHYGIQDQDAADLAERDLAINVLGSIRVVRAALPALRSGSPAAIVLFSSLLAIAPAPGLAVYSATKAAVHSLARSIRRELKGTVDVFDVMPDLVATGPMEYLAVQKLVPDEVARVIVESLGRDRFEIPVGRTRIVGLASRLSPALAEALVARAVRTR